MEQRISWVKYTEATPEELLHLKRRESQKRVSSKRDWAIEVLATVQANPRKWLKLEDRQRPANLTRYLKPLGVQYLITDIDKEKSNQATVFVSWGRPAHTDSPDVVVEVSPDDLKKIRKKEALKRPISKKELAQQILEIAKQQPNKWIELKEREATGFAGQSLKPLGLKYCAKDVKDGRCTFFVKWETE
jgi:hypothetical protein